MKILFMKSSGLAVLSILFMTLTKPVKAFPPVGEGITFSFANPQVTTSGPDKYFEFDIMAHATANTQFELAQIYIDYNTAAFGTDISGTVNLTITKGALLNTVNHSGTGGDIGSYDIYSSNNTTSRISIYNSWQKTDLGGGENGYDLTNTLGTTDQVYIHIKIKVQDWNQSSGLSFNTSISQWDEQDYYFTSGDVAINYAPVTESSTLDYGPPLPVELSSFNAKVKGSNVELLWKTTTEVNNHGFEVERKMNDNESAVWEKVGFVAGSGNSNSPKDYTFVDKNVTGGAKFSYRLKQIDNDGSYTYSNNVEVEVVPEKFELFQNYPNPFNPSTTIKFSLPQDSRIAINIYNILGEKITQLLNADYKAGYYKIQFNSTDFNLASGIYLYTIESKNFKAVKKMVLMK